MKKIIAIVLVVLFLFSSCSESVIDDFEESTTQIQIDNSSSKIIATWIYYNEIEELVNSSNNAGEFTLKVEDVIEKLQEFSVNTVILHIRAFDDAFYSSKLFPVSKYCADDNGKLKFDVLKTFISVCHSKDISVWGWINPYRINKFDDTSNIKKGFFQYDALNSNNEELLIHSDGGVYYNPADKNVQRHIIDGIREILDNYNVDGIHFDDYFYPRTDKNIDKCYYEKYKNSGGNLSLDDFRRENVNSLILSVCSLVRRYNKVFSISPVSNINTNFNNLYADVKLWASTNSYVDYIIPQIYFGFENPIQPFADVLNEWSKLTGDTSKLVIGLAMYKSGTTEVFEKGKHEWNSRDVISKQIAYICENYENVGFVYYSASFLYIESDKEIEVENNNIKRILNQYLPASVT